MIEGSGARVIVCLGSFAERAVRTEFEITESWQPCVVGGIERLFVFLPHPNARKPRKFSPEGIKAAHQFFVQRGGLE